MELLRRGGCDLTRRGWAAIDLVHQVADAISAVQNRSETLLARALDQLTRLEDRNRALEARAIAAEASACEAEEWLTRLHDKIENELVESQCSHKAERPLAPQSPAEARVPAACMTHFHGRGGHRSAN